MPEEFTIRSNIGFNRVYPNQISGCIAYWDFSDGSGLIVTDKVGNNTGSIIISARAYYPFDGNALDNSCTPSNNAVNNNNNGSVFGATITTDRFNQSSAYLFNGTSDYINIGSSSSFNPNNRLHVGAFVNLYSLNNNQYILSKHSGTSKIFGLSYNNSGFQYEILQSGTQGSNGSAVINTSGNYIIGSNTWYHVFGTASGTMMNLYINGSLYKSGTYTGSIQTAVTTPLWIGSTFNGKLDEILINYSTGQFNDSFSQGTINHLYNFLSGHNLNQIFTQGRFGYGIETWGVNSIGVYCNFGSGISDQITGSMPFTLSCWVAKSTPGAGDQSSIGVGWYGGNWKGPYIRHNNTSSSSYTIGRGNTQGTNSNFDSPSISTPGSINIWKHLCLVYNGGSSVFYINGSALNINSDLGSGVDNGSGGQMFSIGKNPWDVVTLYTGKVDEACVYNRSLDQNEVRLLYDGGNITGFNISNINGSTLVLNNNIGFAQINPSNISGCIAWWSFEGDIVDRINNISGVFISSVLSNGRFGSGISTAGSNVYARILPALGSYYAGNEWYNGSILLAASGGTNEWSINAWIKNIGSPLGASGQWINIIAGRVGDNTSFGISGTLQTDRNYHSIILRTDDAEFKSAGSYPMFNVWSNIHVSWKLNSRVGDNGSPFYPYTELYYNGNLVSAGSYRYANGNPYTSVNSGSIYIGWDQRNTGGFNGYIDELSIYSRFIDRTEVKMLADAGSIGKFNLKTASTNILLKETN